MEAGEVGLEGLVAGGDRIVLAGVVVVRRSPLAAQARRADALHDAPEVTAGVRVVPRHHADSNVDVLALGEVGDEAERLGELVEGGCRNLAAAGGVSLLPGGADSRAVPIFAGPGKALDQHVW